MKSLSLLALAVVAAAPFAAHGEPLSVRACANAYIAENFAGRDASVRIDEAAVTSYAPRLPLIAFADQRVKLTVTEVSTGRVLGSATCSTKMGTVTVTSIN